MEFSNLQVNLDEIPDFKSVVLQPISNKYKSVLWISWLIPFLIVMLIPGAVFYFLSFPLLYLLGIYTVLIIVFLFSAIEIHKGFPRRKFGVRELDIIHQKGFFVFTETVVPFKRVQHVEIKQGPLLRVFNLYALKLYTAGASTGDLVINGISIETAQKLKTKILQIAENEEIITDKNQSSQDLKQVEEEKSNSDISNG